jgi:6-pyruvoyltetrahydropterin/6-carboxytetrahydropterin synthase
MVYLTRKEQFAASHRLFNPTFSDVKNFEVFGKCANPNGHGHNYEIEVTLIGMPDPETGMIMDLKKLSDLVEKELLDKVDHKHLNMDVDFLKGIIPTAENLAVKFWNILEPKIPAGKLYSIKLAESGNNIVEYKGE